MAGRVEGAGEGFGLLLPLALGAEVEVEEGGVQLAPQLEAPLLVPTERRPAPPAVRWTCTSPHGCSKCERSHKG